MSEGYYIWSNQHRAWWRPDSEGYCQDVMAAGIYTRDEALDICAKGRDGWTDFRPDEIPVAVADVRACQAMVTATSPTSGGGA